MRFDPSQFNNEPVLGILRGVSESSLIPVLEACVRAGLTTVEITFNTKNAAFLIDKAARVFSGSLCIGAGTVLSVKDAETAQNSGAQFLVAPTLNESVAGFCREREIPYFPGAFTPGEIEKAWNAGATMVKVFPTSQVSPKYFKEIKGPFSHFRLMAVGGVHCANAGDYLAAGADALAFGASIFSPERIESGDYNLIQKDIQEFLLAVQNFYSKL